jgi:hypothetical protein
MPGDVVSLYQQFGVALRERPSGAGPWVTTHCFLHGHDDRHASARVNIDSGGFRCFGCDRQGGILDALAELGVRDRAEAIALAVEHGVLEARQARSAGRRPLRAVPFSAKPEAGRPRRRERGVVDYDQLVRDAATAPATGMAWTYTDAAGVVVGRVRRLDVGDGTKMVWQERPDGAGGFVAGMNGVQLPLLDLPGVRRRAEAGEQVVVVEGEKAAATLGLLDIFATTNAAGAGKWRPEHTVALVGANIVIFSDSDAAGRHHALDVAAALLDAGIAVRVPIDLAPWRHDGVDIVDHLVAVAHEVRGDRPELERVELRCRLRRHVDSLILGAVTADGHELQLRRELDHFMADPTGRALLVCPRCRRQRVHRLAVGYLLCPCGDRRAR